MLIAPASGEETRADITDKVSEFGEKSVSAPEKGAKRHPDSRG